jgi:disulfide bond formation protein DsbB
MTLVSFVTFMFSCLSLVAIAMSLVLIVMLAMGKKPAVPDWIAWAIATIATSGSLFYSEVAGYIPCKLCWYQRIFMYPLVLIIGLALVQRKKAADFILALSIPGFLIAAYHITIQWLALAVPGISDACSATGASCVSAEFMTFGFISIPFMSASAFLLLIVLAIVQKRSLIAQ